MPLCCTPETNIILEIIYISLKQTDTQTLQWFQFTVSLRLLSFKCAYGSRGQGQGGILGCEGRSLWKCRFHSSGSGGLKMLTLPVLHDLTSLLWGCYLLQRSTHSKRASLKGLTSEQSSGSRNCPGETVAKGERSRWREKPVPKPGKGRGTWTRGAGGGGEDAMQEVEGGCWSGKGRGHVGYLRVRVPLLIASGSSKMFLLTLSQENSRQRACASSLFLAFFFLRHQPPPLPHHWSLQRPSPT